MVKFFCDIDDWVFPLCFHYTMVGNRHRPWTFKVEFLCFALVICIIERIRSIVDEAIIASVHELIEYLHYNDIQDLDEEEFSVRVRRLIFESDPAYCLPF